MKAPLGHYIIEGIGAPPRSWQVIRRSDGVVVWRGKTYSGARTAHYRLTIAAMTGKPVSYRQARRAGNC